MSRWEEAGPAIRTPQQSSRNKCWSTTSGSIRGNSRRVSNILFGGGGLLGQFGAEFLLFFSHELFVAIGIDEGVRSAGFQVRIFLFQAEVAAVGAQENIAGQGPQNGKQSLVVLGDLRI